MSQVRILSPRPVFKGLAPMEANTTGTERKNAAGTGADAPGIVPEPLASTDPDEQRHYTDMSFIRQHREKLLEHHSDDEVVAGFQIFAQECGLGRNLPVPPRGLPGTNQCTVDETVMEIIRDASRYPLAIAKGERRTLWNIHERIADELRKAYFRGRASVDEEIARSAINLSRESQERVDNAKVYFIQTLNGEIKIGMAQDVAKRLAGLQTAHPVKLTLLAVAEGGSEQEKAYHRQFAEHRLHGEWFSPHPDILAEIERLCA